MNLSTSGGGSEFCVRSSLVLQLDRLGTWRVKENIASRIAQQEVARKVIAL